MDILASQIFFYKLFFAFVLLLSSQKVIFIYLNGKIWIDKIATKILKDFISKLYLGHLCDIYIYQWSTQMYTSKIFWKIKHITYKERWCKWWLCPQENPWRNGENEAASFQCWKKKNYQSRMLYPPKLSFQTENEIRHRHINQLETICPCAKNSS